MDAFTRVVCFLAQPLRIHMNKPPNNKNCPYFSEHYTCMYIWHRSKHQCTSQAMIRQWIISQGNEDGEVVEDGAGDVENLPSWRTLLAAVAAEYGGQNPALAKRLASEHPSKLLILASKTLIAQVQLAWPAHCIGLIVLLLNGIRMQILGMWLPIRFQLLLVGYNCITQSAVWIACGFYSF